MAHCCVKDLQGGDAGLLRYYYITLDRQNAIIGTGNYHIVHINIGSVTDRLPQAEL